MIFAAFVVWATVWCAGKSEQIEPAPLRNSPLHSCTPQYRLPAKSRGGVIRSALPLLLGLCSWRLATSYRLDGDRCVVEKGNPPGRLINGSFAPNATANPDRGEGPNPCGCDPGFNQSLYQVNLRKESA